MIDIDLPPVVNEDFISQIPEQREKIDGLMEKGIILSYSLAMDRSKLWVILKARGEKHAMKIMATMPLYKYFQIQIVPLAFHNHVTLSLPEVLPN